MAAATNPAPEMLHALVEGERARFGLPGIAYAFVNEGQVVASGGVGWANVEDETPVGADAGFPIASLSKPFTAMAIMQQVERGRLDLDEPVNNYLTTFRIEPKRQSTPAVTTRHLLTHCAGIGEILRWSDLFKSGRGNNRDPNLPEIPLRERFGDVLTVDASVGKKWAYANYGYMALGALIENLTGSDFPDYLRKEVLDPLGMPRTAVSPAGTIPGPMAVRYENPAFDGNFIPIPVPHTTDVNGAGAIVAPVEELAHLVIALTSEGAYEGRAVIKNSSIEEMTRTSLRYEGIGGMGLGLLCVRHLGLELRGHGGNTEGGSSMMLYSPEAKAGVVILTNTYTLGTSGIALRLLAALIGQDVNFHDGLISPVDPDVLRGVYRPTRGLRTNLQMWMYMGGEIFVGRQDQNLVMRGAVPAGPLGKPIVLKQIEDGDDRQPRFEFELEGTPLTLAFNRDSDGNVRSLHFGGLLGFFRVHRRPRLTGYRLLVPLELVAALAAIAFAISRLF